MSNLFIFLFLIKVGFFGGVNEIEGYFKTLFNRDRDKALHIPCILPTDTYNSTSITSLYGSRNHPVLHKLKHHDGIDISVRNANVVSTARGKILKTGYSRGYGNYVIIDHLNGYTTLYGHLSKILVNEQDRVDIAQVIGVSGATGLVTGEHIHYEIHFNSKSVNPISYLLLLYDYLYRNT